MGFDSRPLTQQHIEAVAGNMGQICGELRYRAEVHDRTKLEGIEKEYLDAIGPQTRTELGSDEYKRRVSLLRPMLAHHYAYNSHHPQHYQDGMTGMCLLDLIEMLCDWKAANDARDNQPFDIDRSIEYARKDCEISDQLASILRNTAQRLGWAAALSPDRKEGE